MKEIKTVVTDKNHFDKRDEIFLLPTFWKLCTIKILMQGAISMVFSIKPSSTEVRFSIDNLLKELIPCSCRELLD